MVHKLYFLAGLAVGYVLGTRAGRERYEELKAQAARVAEDPKVRAVAEEAREKATEVAAAGVEKVKEDHPGAQGSEVL